jgi:hypothetical protein
MYSSKIYLLLTLTPQQRTHKKRKEGHSIRNKYPRRLNIGETKLPGRG